MEIEIRKGVILFCTKKYLRIGFLAVDTSITFFAIDVLFDFIKFNHGICK
jgi:hypothetical protein